MREFYLLEWLRERERRLEEKVRRERGENERASHIRMTERKREKVTKRKRGKE